MHCVSYVQFQPGSQEALALHHSRGAQPRQHSPRIHIKFNRPNGGFKALLVAISCSFALFLSGCGVHFANDANAAVLVALPSTVTFPAANIGQTTNGTVSLTNSSLEPVEITQMSLTGRSFSAVGLHVLPVTIPAGGTYSVGMQFNPATAGANTGQISLTNSTFPTVPTLVDLIGTATAATSTTPPTAPAPVLKALSCGNSAWTGSGVDECTVTLSAAAPSGGVTVRISSGNQLVAVPATLTVPGNLTYATFNAAVSTTQTAQVVNLVASISSGSANFAIELNAAAPKLGVNAVSFAFGNVFVGTKVTQNLALTSTGTAPVTITAISITGSGFTALGAAFPAVLSPGQAMTLVLQFDPAIAGAAAGQLKITSNSETNTGMSISLGGEAIAPSSFATAIIGSTPGRAIPADFLGFSHEWGTAQQLFGSASTGRNLAYRKLLQNLLNNTGGSFHSCPRQDFSAVTEVKRQAASF